MTKDKRSFSGRGAGEGGEPIQQVHMLSADGRQCLPASPSSGPSLRTPQSHPASRGRSVGWGWGRHHPLQLYDPSPTPTPTPTPDHPSRAGLLVSLGTPLFPPRAFALVNSSGHFLPQSNHSGKISPLRFQFKCLLLREAFQATPSKTDPNTAHFLCSPLPSRIVPSAALQELK